MRLLSTAVLVRSGYHVDAAEDGAAGWEALQVKQYDLLITDNAMPKVTGVEMVKMLRGQNAALPVIMVSAAIPTEELKRHPWLDISAFLLKPYNVVKFLETVNEVLRGAEGTRCRTENHFADMTGAGTQPLPLARGASRMSESSSSMDGQDDPTRSSASISSSSGSDTCVGDGFMKSQMG